MTKAPRNPQSFAFEEPPPSPATGPHRRPQAFDTGVVVTPDAEDPFLGDLTTEALVPVERSRRRFPFFKIFASAIGLILSIAFGLWLDGLIRALFGRADWMGYTAVAVVAVALLALVGMVWRELAGMRRLASVHALRKDAEVAALDRKPAHARAVVARLIDLSRAMPETASGRAALESTRDEIIDAQGLLSLAELELLAPADRKARQLVLNAAKRVSVVTAVSPRALVDLGYVIFESARLVRAVAESYGTRPGKLGMIGLLRDVVAHLAVTGSIAVGDSLVQQVLGHGIASRLSARFGEGVINGLMTARIGIAAMDLLRPLPFKAVRRPGISDFLGDLTAITGEKRN